MLCMRSNMPEMWKEKHFAAVCFTKDVRFLDQTDIDDENEMLSSLTLETSRTVAAVEKPSKQYSRKVYAVMDIGKKLLRLQTDSGASYDVLKVDDLPDRRLRPALRDISDILRMYDNSAVQPAGRCKINLKNPRNNKTHQADFVVVKDAPSQPMGP